jgi:hypothetical protein
VSCTASDKRLLWYGGAFKCQISCHQQSVNYGFTVLKPLLCVSNCGKGKQYSLPDFETFIQESTVRLSAINNNSIRIAANHKL